MNEKFYICPECGRKARKIIVLYNHLIKFHYYDEKTARTTVNEIEMNRDLL